MTLDPEALERAARAIYEGRNGNGCKPWTLLTKAHKEPYLLDAKAAWESYLGEHSVVVPREPTPEMRLAANRVWSKGDRTAYFHQKVQTAVEGYRAMLSAAPTAREKGE